jgi:plasmid stability protein
MTTTLSIKSVPDDVADRLRARAERNHRSLQGELMAIIEDAVRPPRRLTAAEFLADIRARGLHTPDEATAIIRADRDRHAAG